MPFPGPSTNTLRHRSVIARSAGRLSIEHVEPSNPNLSISEPLTSADLEKKMGRRWRPWTDPDNFRGNFRGIREVESREKSCGPFSEANKRRRTRRTSYARVCPLNIYRHSAGETCTLILAADDLVDFPSSIINPESDADKLSDSIGVYVRCNEFERYLTPRRNLQLGEAVGKRKKKKCV